jgi:hypothetical protein
MHSGLVNTRFVWAASKSLPLLRDRDYRCSTRTVSTSRVARVAPLSSNFNHFKRLHRKIEKGNERIKLEGQLKVGRPAGFLEITHQHVKGARARCGSSSVAKTTTTSIVCPAARRRSSASATTSARTALLKAATDSAVATSAFKPKALERATVDTTVQGRVIAYPTDSRILEIARHKVVRVARCCISLKQTEFKRIRHWSSPRKAGIHAGSRSFAGPTTEGTSKRVDVTRLSVFSGDGGLDEPACAGQPILPTIDSCCPPRGTARGTHPLRNAQRSASIGGGQHTRWHSSKRPKRSHRQKAMPLGLTGLLALDPRVALWPGATDPPSLRS